MKKTTLTYAGLAAVLVTAMSVLNASGQVLTYRFNEPGGITAVNSGSGGTAFDLTMVNATGAPADFHSAKNASLSGPDGSASLDLTSATGMGKASGSDPFFGPLAYSERAGAVFSNAKSFTVTGWYRASQPPKSSGARLLQTGNLFVFFSTGLGLGTGAGTVNSKGEVIGVGTKVGTSGTAFTDDQSAGVWKFFAVTYSYDTSVAQGTVGFYLGDADPSLPLNYHSVTYSGPSIVPEKNSSQLILGNNSQRGGIRPFQGALDEINVFTSDKDQSAALTAEAIAALRAACKTGAAK